MVAGALLAALLALLPAAARADPPDPETGLPTYGGGMGFQAIRSPVDPEEFSWEVNLGQEQELRQVDERDVAVYYSDDVLAFGIAAEPAHDAEGARVPTTLTVSGENEITLTVHHREGNPAAGGAPFKYPILAGEGWEGGFQTTIVQGPLDEKELREQRERREQEEERQRRERAQGEESGALILVAHCHVPGLRGATLDGARRRLQRAHCRLGAIAKTSGATAKAGRIVAQSAAAGSAHPLGAKVGVKLGSRPVS